MNPANLATGFHAAHLYQQIAPCRRQRFAAEDYAAARHQLFGEGGCAAIRRLWCGAAFFGPTYAFAAEAALTDFSSGFSCCDRPASAKNQQGPAANGAA
jgi:hypothetical protein